MTFNRTMIVLVMLALQWDEVLQPRTDTSPDGRWTLSIEPSQRDGGGPAHYLCLRDGDIAWSGERPWTFWASVITDDGFVAGYSYSQDGPRQLAKGEFHAVILDPDGAVRLDEVHERESSRFLHKPSHPLGLGVFHQAEPDRVVFRIADPDVNRRREEWWCFQLPGGEEVYRKRLRDLEPDGSGQDTVVAQRGVNGTSLMLFEWRTFDEYPLIRLRFALCDADMQQVWVSGLLDTIDTRESGGSELLREVYESGTLLDGPQPAHFAIGLPRKGEKLRFAVERSAGSWSVREVGRESWSFPVEQEPVGQRFEDLPITRLESRGVFELVGAPPEVSAVRDILAFECSAPDVLRVVRAEPGDEFTLLRVDTAGRVLHEQSVELPERLAEPRPKFWPLGPGAWLATQSPNGVGGRSLAWRVDEDSGTARRLSSFECPSIDDLAALGEGHFVALATERSEHSMSTALVAFDAQGHALWRRSRDNNPEAESSLFSPTAVAVTNEGLVVVVDVIRHTLQLFDADGSYLSRIDLDEAWGRKANYPSGVRADVDGGLLVRDFNGDPPLYRMSSDGAVRAQLSPRFPDGKVVDGLTRHARVATDGRLWATDGERLLRLDEHAVVDLQIGARIDADVLAEPSASALDVFGRALVQDKSSGAVHVFDGQGNTLFVCHPEPADFEQPNTIAHLAATRDGGVVAQRGSMSDEGYVRFGPDGARVGRIGDVGRRLVFSPTDDVAYAGRHASGFVQLDADLQALASFERAPDGSWLTGADEPAVAADGVVASAGASGDGHTQSGSALVLFETADPQAGRAIDLPEGTPTDRLALGRTWAVLSGFKNDGLLVRRSDGHLVRFVVPTVEVAGSAWRFGFDPGTDELVALDAGGRKIHRFALP